MTKCIVRSKYTDMFDNFGYVSNNNWGISCNTYFIDKATRFDSKEEAQEWCNSHQEVIEVEE